MTSKRKKVPSDSAFADSKKTPVSKKAKPTAYQAVYERPATVSKVKRDSPAFYQSGSSNNSVSPTQQNLGRLFDWYRDNPSEEPDKIGIDGAQKYLMDLNVQLDEVVHLALCEFLQCPSLGEFERGAFVTAWRNLSSHDKFYDTAARQSQYVNTLRKKLTTDPSYFKQVYRNAFKLARPEGQRSVPMEEAIGFWKTFFGETKGGIGWNSNNTKWLDMWCHFYETEGKRPVQKDLWNMVGELVLKTQEAGGESLEWWSEEGAWPMVIDQFVEHVKERRKVDNEPMDTS